IYANPGSLPAGVWFAWATSWMDPLAFVSIMLLFLLFPDGALLTRRWRPVVWLVVTVGVGSLAWSALKPGKIFADTLPVANPVGIEWLTTHVGWVDQVISIGFGAGVVLSVASAVVRFRRSRGIERDRMKWLAFAALMLIASIVVAFSGVIGAKPFADL